jgi:hypothetical protein
LVFKVASPGTLPVWRLFFFCFFCGLVPLARVCVSCLCGWPWGPRLFWILLYVVVSYLCFGWFMLQRGFSAPVVFCVGLCSWVGSPQLSVHFGFLPDFLPVLPCSLSHLFVTHTPTAGHVAAFLGLKKIATL